MSERAIEGPFEIYHSGLDIADKNGHICTAENEEIAQAIVAALAAAERVADDHRVTSSCGCVFCDLFVPVDAEGFHSAGRNGERVLCPFWQKGKAPAAERVARETQIGELLRVIEKRDREHNLFNCPSGGWIRQQIKATLALSPGKVADARIEELEGVCGELYQVIGALADYAGLFDHPDVIKALDNASDNAMTHTDLLPFPHEPFPVSPGKVEGWREEADEIERLTTTLKGIAEYCSGDGWPLGAIERLTAIRNTVERAIRPRPSPPISSRAEES